MVLQLNAGQRVEWLHPDNVPSHEAGIMTEFLQKEKVTVLPHPPYSPDLAPCDYFLFPRLIASKNGFLPFCLVKCMACLYDRG